MTRKIKLRNGAADAAQLREELAAANFPDVVVADPDAAGEVEVKIPADVYGPGVDAVLQRHFPRSLVAAVANVDVDSISNLADAKRVLRQFQVAVVRALRARWE